MTPELAQKPELDWNELSAMARVAKKIDTLPPGPAKERAKRFFQDAHAKLLEHYDMPVQVVAPDQHLLGLVDWGSGIVRTGAGETARLINAMRDKVQGNPSSYTVDSALNNLGSALIPVGEPAKSTNYYLEDLGVPPGPSLADVPGMKALGMEKGDRFDVTARGAAGFLGDMGLTPRNIVRGMEVAPELPARVAGGAEAVRDTGRLSEFGPGFREAIPPPPKSYEMPLRSEMTAAQMRAEEEAARKAAIAHGSGSWLDGLKKLAQGAEEAAVDPVKKLGEALHKWRFRHADEATRLAGKTPTSQIMREHGGGGITSEGIRSDMRQAIAQHNEAIDELARGPVRRGMIPPIRRGTPGDYDYLRTREGMKFTDPAGHSTININPAEVEDPTLLYSLYGPGQQAAERDLISGANAQEARRAVEADLRQAEMARPGLESIESTWDDARAAAGNRATIETPNGQQELFRERPTVRTSHRPEETIWTDEGFIRANRPAKTVTSVEGEPAVNVAPRAVDPLNIDRNVGWEEVRDFRKGAQNEAMVRNWYNRRTDKLNPPTPGEAKKVAAEAALYSNMAQHAGELETGMLDEVRPGLGAQVYQRHKAISSMLEGGPFLDRAPKAGPTTKTMTAFNPWTGRAYNIADKAASGAAMMGYHTLTNPWVRYGLAPSARALWLGDVWNRKNSPTVDENGEPGGENPWGLVYKYGAKQ